MARRRFRSSGICRCRMLLGILSVLFLLRFIWTFNKFDDIFLADRRERGHANVDSECL